MGRAARPQQIFTERNDKMATKRSDLNAQNPDANPDPITGAPGAHPVGVGTGAASGGVAGLAIGAAVGGPIGAAVGGVVGAVAGGLTGKAAAEAINPTDEHAYWRENYKNRPYVKPDAPYEEYSPAYQYGWESQSMFGKKAKSFDEVEPELRDTWDENRGASNLDWDEARDATRDAWQRVDRSRQDRMD
jgi:hypothetical protein